MSLHSLKMGHWPEPDRVMWELLIKRGGFLEVCGPGAEWAAETRRVVARDYGYWLTFVLGVHPEVRLEGPTSRPTVERVRAYCHAMGAVSALTLASRIARLCTIMQGADPAREWRWLAEMRRASERAARRAGPARSKECRLRPSGLLFETALNLMKRAEYEPYRSRHQCAKDVRDGLMLALLAARPLRIKNFASLRLGQHLYETSTGYSIDIPGTETKTSRPIETFVPEELVPWLSRYLETYRPTLLGPNVSDFLWVHHDGGYQPGALSMRIGMLTKRLFGVRISPHLFRDCAATTVATDDPHHVMIIAPLLGHGPPTTSEKYYNQARCLEAGRDFQRSIKGARNLMRPLRRRPSSV